MTKAIITICVCFIIHAQALFGKIDLSEKPISLLLSDLTRWKNSVEAKHVQQSLVSLRQRVPIYLKFSSEYFESEAVFRKQFLLLEAEANEFGGVFALVVFKDYPKVFRLWVYEVDANVFEVRESIPLQVTINREIMNELADKSISHLWLSSLVRQK